MKWVHIMIAEGLIPVATYASVLAHLLCRREQSLEVVLGAHGLSMAQFIAADTHYNADLAGSLRKRKGILAMTFASVFAETRARAGLFNEVPRDHTAPPAPPHPPSSSEPQAKPSYLNPGSSGAPASGFHKPSTAAPETVGPPPAAPETARPGVVPPLPPNPLGSTAELPAMAAIARALPFQAHSEPSSSASASYSGTPVVPKPAPSAPKTTPAPPPASGNAASRTTGKLTLAHFAALHVELSRNPPDHGPILRRYGLDGADDLRYVTAAFQAQMMVDPVVRSQFDAMVARMRSAAAARG